MEIETMNNVDDILDNMFLKYFAEWFKNCGVITHNKCYICSNKKHLLEDFSNKIKIPFELKNNTLTYYGSNAVDFIELLFPGEEFYTFFSENELLHVPYTVPVCKFTKTLENAVAPFKSNTSDVGYDLTIIDIKKEINSVCTLYTTGITIDIEHGWYTEIVPRSSIIKSGYMLANSIGIIENTYRGELMIALVKIDKDAPPLELPLRCCQLLIKKQHHARFVNVSEENMTSSIRGEGGFGSTN